VPWAQALAVVDEFDFAEGVEHFGGGCSVLARLRAGVRSDFQIKSGPSQHPESASSY